ncbi:MAG: hypothetical protein IPF66_25145 [Holophagales bacterium]|nr:hypothetical protein [Holophagales bacterium]
MKILNFTFISFVVLGIISCTNGDQKSDAYGNFEANELIVSSEMPGKILQLDVEEGIQLKQGQLVGLVDTVLLQKQKNVIAATIRSIDSKTQSQAPKSKC